jgi:hypothetical protein
MGATRGGLPTQASRRVRSLWGKVGVAWAIAACALLDSGSAARADEPTASPSTANVAPPRLVRGGEVPYPEGAHGDVEVVLELVVDKDGRVQDAHSVAGDEPFASAATSASRDFVFEPAKRGGAPVVAKIRMKVAFVEAHEPSAPPPGAAPPTSAPRAAKPTPIEEVEVRGVKREAGKTTLGQAEIRELPGAFGDAFRAIEMLPGVVPMASGLPFFFVRGAPPGNTGYFLDGVRVPLLYHLALGPAVIHPGLVDHVDFYAGAPPARFGRFAGGFVSGEVREPAKRFHGEGNIRLFDTGLLAEAPFAGGKGTFLGAGRVSYTALLFSAIVPEVRLDYWDYQGRVAYDLTPRDRVSIFAFGSHDFLGEVNEDSGRVKTVFATQFHRLDTRYDRKISGGRMRLAVTLGVDESSLGDEVVSRDRMLATRFELEKKLSDDVLFRAGADGTFDRYDLLDETTGSRGTSDSVQTIYPPRSDFALGARADVVWRLHPRVEVVPGARFDLFGSAISDDVVVLGPQAARTTVIPAVDPRLAVRTKVSPSVTHVSTLGLQHQTPSFVVPIPGLQVGRLSEGLQSAVHASQGVEVALPWKLSLAPTVFVANSFGLTDAVSTCGTDFDVDDPRCVRRVSGQTYGLELSLRRAFGERFTGFFSYTLARSTRLTRPLGFRQRGGVSSLGQLGSTLRIAGEFDRTHVMNLAASYLLGAGWRVGARFYFYTGRPYSEEIRGVPIPPYNGYRYPDFHRFDFRVEKRWTFGSTGYVAFVAEWLNATLRKEAFSLECASFGDSPDLTTSLPGSRCKPQEVGPITIPSLGVEGGF